MKKLITLILFLAVAQISYGQLDNATKNKIKVMYLSAENLYKSNEYSKTLNEIDKIESLSNGLKLATAQNLKVKSLIGLKRFKEAQKELEVLYNLNPSKKILTDIAQYSSKIDDGLEEERLALVRKKETARIEKEKVLEAKERQNQKQIKDIELAKERELKRQKDQQNWDYTLQTGTKKAFENYLNNSQNKLYRGEVSKYLLHTDITTVKILPKGRYSPGGKELINFEDLYDIDQIKYYFNITKLIVQIELDYFPLEILKLPNLKSLSIRKGKFQDFPKEISQLKGLQKLELKSKLNTVPETLWDLTELTTLDIAGNNLTYISENIGKLTKLRELNISYNNLNKIPENIWNLTNLQDLSISNNYHLKVLPEGIGNLKNLYKLDISNINLIQLPENIGNLNKLQYLYMNKYKGKELPESFGNLKILKSLYISNSELQSIPNSIYTINSLREIKLNNKDKKTKKLLSKLKKYNKRLEIKTESYY